jgi:hypothetical protein
MALAIVAVDPWLSSPDGERAAAWQGERTPRSLVIANQEKIKETIAKHPTPTLVFAFVYDLSGPNDPVLIHMDVMRACQDLGLPCVNGYSGYLPLGWDNFSTKKELMNWLESRHVQADKMAGLVLIGAPSTLKE